MYIKLEDVKKILKKEKEIQLLEFGNEYFASVIDLQIEYINSLPTINPTKVLEEMIEEIKKEPTYYDDWETKEIKEFKINILKEAINRINQ